jgi:predicted Fe-S protein YdhL (DUF1289 family)
VTDEVWRREGAVESPCIKLCLVHPEARLCLGCYRTIEEIAAWSSMTPEARRAVMAELPGRAHLVKPVRRGGRGARRGEE